MANLERWENRWHHKFLSRFTDLYQKIWIKVWNGKMYTYFRNKMKFSHSFARKCQVHFWKYEKRSKLANHSRMGICKHISKKKGMKFPIVLVEDVSFYVRSISGKRWSIVVSLNPNHINHDSWQAGNLEKKTYQKKKKKDFMITIWFGFGKIMCRGRNY